MVVQVKLVSKDGSTLETYAILDDCSESTFIRHDVAKRLGWHMQEDAIDLSTIKGEAEESTNVHQMKLEISSIDESFSVTVKEAYAVDKGSFNMPARPKFNNCKGNDAYKLDGIILDAVDPDKITVLIGADAPEAHIQQDVRRGEEGQPLAIKTAFGWTLFGTSRRRAVHTAACYHISGNVKSSLPSLWKEDAVKPTVHVNQLRVSTRMQSDQQLDQFLPKFW